MHFLLWIIVGLVGGWLTGKIMKPYGYGLLMDVLSGITGAVVGGFMTSAVGEPGQIGTIPGMIVAFQLAIVLTAFVALASGRKRYGWGREVVPERRPRRLERQRQSTLSQPEGA
jgi:uncharacterized membrane protein YeaQ/YmgE (transglycosylase-associated protein family)